jgi:trk system potassium uptake protein TrkH
MRASVVLQNMSRLLWFAVVSLTVPLLVSIGYRDQRWWAFAIPALLAAMLAYSVRRLPSAQGPTDLGMKRREGFLAVVLGWGILIFFTALAYNLTGSFGGFAAACFESSSGYTTTGATVITNIEALPMGVLFMRSFSHWIGGMGIIVLSVAILPQLAVGGMQMFSAEASGIDSEKLAPRIAQTARRLWVLYFGITATLTLLLLPKMSLFDAINHAMSTIATGGFSTKNDSLASFGLYVEIVIMLFMFVSATSFVAQYRAFIQHRHPLSLFASAETRLFTLITLVAIWLISVNVYFSDQYETMADSLRYSSFQVVSIITTTGFGTADFDAWPHFSRLALVSLMLIGGCAGSTAGGIKAVRLYVVIKYAGNQLRRLVRPRLVQPLYIGDREVSRDTTEGIIGFLMLYAAMTLLGALVVTALGVDFESGVTASVSAMNSIGPGLGSVGATQNFGHIADAGKYVLSFEMLLGRLEIYTLLVVFTPHFWRRG